MTVLLRTLCLALVLLVASANGARAMPAVGERAPRFALRPLQDNTVLVSSKRLFEGQTTLVSFFATWCKPCKQEIPELKILAERYADRGFRVVLVCLDQLGVREVARYLEEAGSGELQVLWDRYGRTREAYAVGQLPTNVLVGPDETVRLAWEMFQPEKLAELDALLEQLPRPAEPGADGG